MNGYKRAGNLKFLPIAYGHILLLMQVRTVIYYLYCKCIIILSFKIPIRIRSMSRFEHMCERGGD